MTIDFGERNSSHNHFLHEEFGDTDPHENLKWGKRTTQNGECSAEVRGGDCDWPKPLAGSEPERDSEYRKRTEEQRSVVGRSNEGAEQHGEEQSESSDQEGFYRFDREAVHRAGIFSEE